MFLRLAATDVSLGFTLSEFELGRAFWEDDGDTNEDEVDGRTLACATTLSQSENISRMTREAIVNDSQHLNFMVFADSSGYVFENFCQCFGPNDEQKHIFI